MKKAEAEAGIRHLCHVWAELRGVEISPHAQPSFSDFYSWVNEHHHLYLDFRSTTSCRHEVERWFDAEMKQTWRN